MPKVFGTFTKKSDRIFRTETYIEWGSSYRNLGCFIGLNPGSAKLMDTSLQNKIENGLSISGEIKADPTIKQLIAFVKTIHGAKVSGRLTIYNLFYLKDPKAKRAINVLGDLYSEGLDWEGNIPSIEKLKCHPWILLSWGLENKPHIKQLKKIWLSRIEEAGVPYFGKVHERKKDYYHICPHLIDMRRTMIDELARIYLEK